jgi:hypothetical protein
MGGVRRGPVAKKNSYACLHREFLFARGYSVSVHFLRNKIEDAGLKLLGSKLRALSGAERRLLDTVLIHNTVPG